MLNLVQIGACLFLGIGIGLATSVIFQARGYARKALLYAGIGMIAIGMIIAVVTDMTKVAHAQSTQCPETTEDFVELWIVYSQEDGRQIMMDCFIDGQDAQALVSEDEPSDVVIVDTIEIAKKTTEPIPAGYWISGDVKVNGEPLYDSESATALVVVLHQDAEVYAEWGATASNMVLDRDALDANVVVIDWPEEGVVEQGSVQAGSPVSNASDLGDLPHPVDVFQQGAWTVYELAEIDEGEDSIVGQWIARLENPAPQLWPTYPNVENKLIPAFPHEPCEDNPDRVCVPAGVEYGVPNVPFCQQDRRCDFVVPAWHYRLITADYSFEGMTCENTDANNRKGCLLLLINVMDQSYIWRDQMADNGFTVAGRYWDGDRLEWGVLGLVSHTAANMLNMRTYRNPLQGDVLNSGNGANAGANCGTVDACPYVDATVVVHAGDRVLAVLKTTITRP